MDAAIASGKATQLSACRVLVLPSRFLWEAHALTRDLQAAGYDRERNGCLQQLLQLLFSCSSCFVAAFVAADVNALEDPGGESWTALPRGEAIVISKLLTTRTEPMVTCSHRVVKQGDRGKELATAQACMPREGE